MANELPIIVASNIPEDYESPEIKPSKKMQKVIDYLKNIKLPHCICVCDPTNVRPGWLIWVTGKQIKMFKRNSGGSYQFARLHYCPICGRKLDYHYNGLVYSYGDKIL